MCSKIMVEDAVILKCMLLDVRASPQALPMGSFTSLEEDCSSNISSTNNSPNCKLRASAPLRRLSHPRHVNREKLGGFLKNDALDTIFQGPLALSPCPISGDFFFVLFLSECCGQDCNG
jgi:hypothetical protein